TSPCTSAIPRPSLEPSRTCSLRDPALPGLLGAAADVRDATVAAALGCRRNRSSGPALRGVSAGVGAVGFHIVLDEAHPRAILGGFERYDTDARRHRTLALETPEAGGSGDRWSDRVSARARWAAPRVRTGGLTPRPIFSPVSRRRGPPRPRPGRRCHGRRPARARTSGRPSGRPRRRPRAPVPGRGYRTGRRG